MAKITTDEINCTIEERPLSSQWYVFAKGSYKERSPPVCVLTLTYSDQGESIYITGTHSGEFPTGFVAAMRQRCKDRGIKSVHWEHDGKPRTESV